MKKILSVLLAVMLLLLCGCGPKENEYKFQYLPGFDDQFEEGSTGIYVVHNTDERDALLTSAENEELRNALSGYDEKFFKKRILFVLEVPNNGVSYQYMIKSIYQEDHTTTFELKLTHEHFGVRSRPSMTILIEMDQSWDTEVKNIVVKYT